MTTPDIKKLGSKILNKKSKLVKQLDVTIVKKLSKALKNSKIGVAISAVQIGINYQIFIVDKYTLNSKYTRKYINGEKTYFKFDNDMVFINPCILKYSEKKCLVCESCLSIDNIGGICKRYKGLVIKAFDIKGDEFFIECTGLLAQICQHEMEHLNGKFFLEKCTKVYTNKDTKLQKHSQLNYINC